MSDMIERVGSALAQACLEEFGSTWSNDVRWKFARAAIEAMCIQEYLGALAEICEHFGVPFSVSATAFPENIVTWLAENCVLKSQIGTGLSQDTHSLPSEDR